jgi:hypothetical protein
MARRARRRAAQKGRAAADAPGSAFGGPFGGALYQLGVPPPVVVAESGRSIRAGAHGPRTGEGRDHGELAKLKELAEGVAVGPKTAAEADEADAIPSEQT